MSTPAQQVFIDAPTTPPAGDADSLAGLVPAASAAEIISPKTPPDILDATNVAFEISQLDREQLEKKIEEKATEIVGQFTNRLADELFPLLYAMRSRLPHGQWGKWYAAFAERHPINLTLRSVQRKFAELEEGWGVKVVSRGSARKRVSPAVKQAEQLLEDAKEAFGKAAEGGSEQAKATIAQYEQEYTNAVTTAGADEAPPTILFPIIKPAMDCNGCRDMHEGIALLAKAHPDWSEEQLVEATGCSLTIIRQAFTRFLAWRATA